VIVLEVDSASQDETNSLLYVAMSRARFRLFVICPEESRRAIEQRMIDGIKIMAGQS
jgi:hypothetical protein